MTQIEATLPPDDELIDRLADGELTPYELRAAIDRLDRIPDGWKRCAAAFLEAQCWRDSFRAMGEPPASQDHGNSFRLALRNAPAKRPAPRWLRGMIAAGILAGSFAIGWLSHRPPQPSTTAQLAASGPPIAPVGAAADQSESRLLTKQVPGFSNPAQSVEQTNDADRFAIPRSELVQTVARLRIGNEGTTEVPILAGPGITEEWLQQQPPPLSENGQVVFEQHGYQVDQRRRLFTAVTPDGQRMTVPIDQVQIRYVGNQSL
jgi:hypothetical protein